MIKVYTARIRIVIVDDHAIIRSALRKFLEAQPDMRIVGEAATGLQALAMVRALQPDIVLLDVELPGMKGDEVANLIRAQAPRVQVLAVSGHRETEVIRNMLAHGAAGYVGKDEIGDYLPVAIRFLVSHHRETWLSPALQKRLLSPPLALAN